MHGGSGRMGRRNDYYPPLPPPFGGDAPTNIRYPGWTRESFDDKERHEEKQFNALREMAQRGDYKIAYELLINVTNDIRSGRRYFRDLSEKWSHRFIIAVIAIILLCGVIAAYPRIFPPPHGGPPPPNGPPPTQQGAPNVPPTHARP